MQSVLFIFATCMRGALYYAIWALLGATVGVLMLLLLAAFSRGIDDGALLLIVATTLLAVYEGWKHRRPLQDL